MSNQFIEKLRQVLVESKRRFVALPLEKQWFGSLVGFLIGFICFASVLRFDPQNLLGPAHFAYLFLLVTAYVGAMLLALMALMAYKAWQGNRYDPNKLILRIQEFCIHLAWYGIVLAAVFYDAIVLIFI